jgi:molybdopterin molybdotransferase
MRVFTGAPLPAFADTVVMQENALADARGDVTFTELPARGSHVRGRGSDLEAGALALGQGHALGAGEIGLLAALGCAEVAVHRAPRVAIVSVGDELRALGAALSPFEIVNSNAMFLAARVRQLGAEPLLLRTARDDLADVVAVLEEALSADVVLTSGGVSVGDHDHVAGACARAGVERRFAKVAIKPGKPLWFGMRGDVPVVGLPGNPVSTMVTFEVFVRPALRHMLGHAAPYPSLIGVALDHAHRHTTGRPELARGALFVGGEGPLRARLHARQGSGALPSMAGADALIVLDGQRERFEVGEPLPALLLDGGPHQSEPTFA